MLEKVTSFEYPVIDMDCHITEPPEVFTEYLQPKFRQLARDRFDIPGNPVGLAALSRGEPQALGHQYRMFLETPEVWEKNKVDPNYHFPGAWDGPARLGCMDAEGIDAGVVRNTFMAGIFHLPDNDIELTEALCQAYNNWIHDFCSADPNRLFGEALLPCSDVARTVREMERCAKMGFKGSVVRGSTAGKPLSDVHYDPIWARMQEYGWPLCIHTAFDERVDAASQWLCQNNKMQHPQSGPAFFTIMENLNFMLDNIVTLGEITLGGMLERFPKLNVYFIESGHSWVGETLYRLDKSFDVPLTGVATIGDYFFPDHKPRTTIRPSELFARQVYVAFEGGDQTTYYSQKGITDFSKNLIWASDIPHWDADGPWEGAGALRAMKVTKEVEARIMGANAAKILGVPHVKRVGTSGKAVKIAA